MSIKKYFGKKLLDLVRQADHDERGTVESSRVNKLHDMFNGCMPAMVAFKIDNGYVVRSMNAEELYAGGRAGGFAFCKDHAEIAEYIVASEAKRKLGVGEQQELFTERMMKAQAAQVNRAINPPVTTGRRI